MDDDQPAGPPSPRPAAPARSFGAVADAYDRSRPSYPRPSAVWLTGERSLSVLEVGAGTGKLTRELVALGHDVHATDPDQDMLSRLSLAMPEVRVSQAPAEELPVADRSVDVVVGAQCFHWVDPERALPEIARVLRPGGRVAMTWAERDERIPWVRRLGALLRGPREGSDPDWSAVLTDSGLFGPVEQAVHPFWQSLDRDRLRDLVLSRSHVMALSEEEQAERLAAALELYDGFGRGHDGMQLPYAARSWRASLAGAAAGGGPGGGAGGAWSGSDGIGPGDVRGRRPADRRRLRHAAHRLPLNGDRDRRRG